MANIGYIQVARMCDQYCRFCSNPANDEMLTYDQAKVFVDDLVTRGYDGVIFTGGEPTINPELGRMVDYARGQGLARRMITDGQNIARKDYLQTLVDAGMELMHVSLHSVRPEIQGNLTGNLLSHANIMKALANAGELGAPRVQINTVINRYNSDHLDENVRVLCERFPFIRHFVWNNMDTEMNRVQHNRDTIPRLADFELSLYRACKYLDESGRTFRVERVPLCYMVEYAHCSTETRKIVKDEERIVHFLDFKGSVRQTGWRHNKGEVCKACRYDPICGGCYSLGRDYPEEDLHPVFLDPDAVRRKVLGTTMKPRPGLAAEGLLQIGRPYSPSELAQLAAARQEAGE
ncbi:MAG: radical SAM protein [Myxococcota bacterium]